MFFFFQAEDGIGDLTVTGFQTCALPISAACATTNRVSPGLYRAGRDLLLRKPPRLRAGNGDLRVSEVEEIGRASCRERVEVSVVAVSLKKKEITVWGRI